ncbi:MAG: hypothetical protein SFV52_02650 [Saprospiraceae bacterium]|nr:hypothetical protein [Saprospiraceae bacterium]
MNPFVSFIRTTVTGGILFLIPVALLIVLLEKAGAVVRKLTAPFDPLMPDRLLGFDGSALLVVFLMIAISFVAGLLFRSPRVKKWVASIEDTVLINIPGYSMMKTVVADALGQHADDGLLPVWFQDGDAWKLAFLVEEDNRFCTLYCPGAPKVDSGEVVIVPAGLVRKIAIPSNKITKSLKIFGKGAIAWMDMPKA